MISSPGRTHRAEWPHQRAASLHDAPMCFSARSAQGDAYIARRIAGWDAGAAPPKPC